jgi:dihydroorotate dehydrogenase (NAD+) catalytic subunit
MIDMQVTIADITLPNPVGVASGTFGYGSEYETLLPVAKLGALFTKAVTKDPRPGNAIPRIVETPGGLLNSIGLANVGRVAFASDKYPVLRTIGCPVFINVAGSFEDDYAETLEYLEEHAPLSGYEINVSCPNVKCGGMALGTDPTLVENLTKRLRALTKRPLIIKLSPNVTDITSIAKAAEAGGADAISCINTLVGMLIDTKKQKPLLSTITGGLSGPAILPVGLAATWKVSRAVHIPVIGMGGIVEPDHAIQYLLAGAQAIQLGTINFIDPTMAMRIITEIGEYMEKYGIQKIADFQDILK